MRESICEYRSQFPESPLSSMEKPIWEDIVKAANTGDSLAKMVLAEYCSYLSHALISVLKILNISTIIAGYTNPGRGTFIEEVLQTKLSNALLFQNFGTITVKHSFFDDNAPLIGSISFINNKIFNGELPI